MTDRRQELERELTALKERDAHNAWADEVLKIFTPLEKHRIYVYLSEWIKSQPGHNEDCRCGECD